MTQCQTVYSLLRNMESIVKSLEWTIFHFVTSCVDDIHLYVGNFIYNHSDNKIKWMRMRKHQPTSNSQTGHLLSPPVSIDNKNHPRLVPLAQWKIRSRTAVIRVVQPQTAKGSAPIVRSRQRPHLRPKWLGKRSSRVPQLLGHGLDSGLRG